MTDTTPLEQALAAWNRYHRDPENRQSQVDDATALGETGVFSIRQIAAITGLPETFAYQLLDKSTKDGGRFNPEALPHLYDLALEWKQAGVCNRSTLRLVVTQGVSPNMVSRLVEGISRSAIYRYLEES